MNNLTPTGPFALAPVMNALNRDEATKGYLHYLIGGGKPYTEDALSDQAYRDLLFAAYGALNKKQGIEYLDYPEKNRRYDPTLPATELGNLIGRTSNDGVRRVMVGGKPYVQVRDLYDFKNDPDAETVINKSLIESAVRGDRFALERLGVIAGQHVGTPYPINMLLPENPGTVASPAELNAFRDRTTYHPKR